MQARPVFHRITSWPGSAFGGMGHSQPSSGCWGVNVTKRIDSSYTVEHG
jgi:hypothetical protein